MNHNGLEQWRRFNSPWVLCQEAILGFSGIEAFPIFILEVMGALSTV
ncbi:MAG: hypothetical protein QNJ46_31130 [Leptolyngbyaceae cyanobacterium MO_188.B28]|nr:hypothetical protein [Leptolyngbyaceae cyanobacterium MO_188.B28]